MTENGYSQNGRALSVAVDCRLMYYRQAGIANYARRLIQAMAALHVPFLKLCALLDRRDEDTFWVPQNVAIVRTFTPAHHRFEHLTLPGEIARFSFDVLHSPDFITCQGRFRKVITIHDLYFLEHPEVMSEEGKRYYSRVRQSARMADVIITPSRFTHDDVLRLMPEIPAEKVRVVYEAADEVREEPTTILLEQRPFVLFVGTLEPRKNLVTLLRALKRLPNEVRLVIVGAEGWGGSQPEAVARSLGVLDRVTIAGQVSHAELDALYRAARVLVMPSLSEGFGLPVLEAMARGTPVVCSNSGALPEIADDAALMHEPLDEATLAQHIRALWYDTALHDEYARRGKERAQMFSWEHAARETIEIYCEAAGMRVPALA